jgi:hypothetical protein
MNPRGGFVMGSPNLGLNPRMPTHAYKTFNIAAPVNTHFRPATCEEIDCPAYLNGWTYRKTDLIAANLYDLVTHAGKRYREQALDEGGELFLVFEPGQICFQAKSHRISLERPQFFFSGRGDHRSYSPKRAYQYVDGAEWSEAFAEHQEILNRVAQEGI